jgi:hypothetical protein
MRFLYIQLFALASSANQGSTEALSLLTMPATEAKSTTTVEPSTTLTTMDETSTIEPSTSSSTSTMIQDKIETESTSTPSTTVTSASSSIPSTTVVPAGATASTSSTYMAFTTSGIPSTTVAPVSTTTTAAPTTANNVFGLGSLFSSFLNSGPFKLFMRTSKRLVEESTEIKIESGLVSTPTTIRPVSTVSTTRTGSTVSATTTGSVGYETTYSMESSTTTGSITSSTVESTSTLRALVLPEVGSRGMQNLGNTCYFNSVMQALVHSPAFRAMIEASPTPAPDSNSGNAATAVLDAIRDLIRAQWSAADGPIDPTLLFGYLHQFGGRNPNGSIFVPGQSNDANIAYGIIMDAIFRAFEYRTDFFIPITDHMGTHVSLVRRCRVLGCQHSTASQQLLWSHSLSLYASGPQATFENLLVQYMNSELEVRCVTCTRTPNTIHENRLSFGNNRFLSFFLNRYNPDNVQQRITTSVHLPMEINMQHFDPASNMIYRLVAVVLYTGGHYYSDVLHQESNIWMRMDDSSVQVIGAPTTDGDRPFLVFYEAI